MSRPLRILVTAGPTREMLDPVRFLSNVSTGVMGYALAQASRARGHRVTLVSGPTALKPPSGVRFVPVLTAREMKRALVRVWSRTDILIMTAAVCDYTPVQYSTKKIKRIERKTVRFKRTEDILASLGRVKGKRVVVGFALETDHYRRNARRKLRRKNLDLIVLNWYGKGNKPFGPRRASMFLIDRLGGATLLRRVTKAKAARRVVSEAVALYRKNS